MKLLIKSEGRTKTGRENINICRQDVDLGKMKRKLMKNM
jgi:hypothetical protein